MEVGREHRCGGDERKALHDDLRATFAVAEGGRLATLTTRAADAVSVGDRLFGVVRGDDRLAGARARACRPSRCHA